MDDYEEQSLDELIHAVYDEHLVEYVDRAGKDITIRVGGETFILSDELACEFLRSLLRIAGQHPDPIPSRQGVHHPRRG